MEIQKKFNITGKCHASRHYMADVSKKLERAFEMVQSGDYFIINRPRQYGKTTTLYSLADMLRKTGEYVVFNASFEGIGDAIFNDEKVFAQGFVRLLAKYSSADAPVLSDWLSRKSAETDSLEILSELITLMGGQTDKKLVLFIDEVDKSSNNQLFVSFLAMLRNKYLEQDDFKTFHSVVLAGLHDVKSLKLKIRPDAEQKFNSPWNIAAEFTVDMNLQPAEIKPMLEAYAADKNVGLDAGLIAGRLFYYTSGYPFLVSKLCKIIDETLLPEKASLFWSPQEVDEAVLRLLMENNTNFDTLAKNIENDPELYQLVYKIAIEGEAVFFNPLDPTINFALLYGIFVNENGNLRIHNRIYQAVLTNYMTARMQRLQMSKDMDLGGGFKNPNKTLDMERILLKFQAFMREQYSGKDRDFLERNGRLVFLAFLKPIINGSGYDFKEPQISEERRLDVAITYLQHQYVAELKIWRGPEAHAQGLEQLAGYLDRLGLDTGYLLIFDHSKKKTWKSRWETSNRKKIFTAWV